jgi:hypothetical protein
MAVSTDTIQTLLRQRQDLREALLDLRKEIETLDASSLDLVNKNIKAAPPATTATPTGAATPTEQAPDKAAATSADDIPASPPPVPAPNSATPEKREPVLTAPKAEPAPVPEPNKEPPKKKETAAKPATDEEPTKEDSLQVEKTKENNPQTPKEPDKKGEARPQMAPHDQGDQADQDHDDLDELLEKARVLSDYLLDHPSRLPAAELGALDAAITVSENAKTPAEKKACYHTLQAAYRKISAGTFAAAGVSGTTLQDSAAGAPLLWTIPFAISILMIVLFPLLLLARHLVGEMFTDDFARDVTWSFGMLAAFLWGTVGALTLLALNIAVAVYHRRFDGGVRRSPALRGALGGLMGAIFFLIVENWLPMSDAAADFALDAIAFAGGMLSALLFAALQRAVNAVTGWIGPGPKTTEPPKK